MFVDAPYCLAFGNPRQARAQERLSCLETFSRMPSSVVSVPPDFGPNILVSLMTSTTILPPSWGRHSHGSEECRREDPTVQSGRGVCMSAGSLDGVANAVSRRSWSRVVAFVLVFVMVASALAIVTTPRSEERRVGKGWTARSV